MTIGLMMFGASLRTKKFKYVAYLALVLYTLCKADFSEDILFPLINAGLIIVIPALIQSVKKGNSVLAPMSLLIYSVAIDIVCYFMFPFEGCPNLLVYIWQGLVFNFKSIVYPSAISVLIVLIRKAYFAYENKALSH